MVFTKSEGDCLVGEAIYAIAVGNASNNEGVFTFGEAFDSDVDGHAILAQCHLICEVCVNAISGECGRSIGEIQLLVVGESDVLERSRINLEAFVLRNGLDERSG